MKTEEEKKAYDNGYRTGEKTPLHEEPYAPSGMSDEERKQFWRGFDNAVEDRLS